MIQWIKGGGETVLETRRGRERSIGKEKKKKYWKQEGWGRKRDKEGESNGREEQVIRRMRRCEQKLRNKT